MGHRRKAREIALQVLYQIDVAETDAKEAIELYWKNFDAPDNAREFSTELIMGTIEHLAAIDEAIGTCSEHWSLERMAKVDKNILRMAVYELLYCNEIPPKATLNEAIDLGKEYGSENSGSFVNGILDAFYAQIRKNDED
ncbi:MAG: transcription antitermination factor NusB [Syntrophales bacterium]|jgi:N utilization substance protein B|nr:transcription antitermination factor NusB [Syntrophales bacterium]MDY0043644.1 transcription antitermination factor NusB [Syntrophales bacterium]